MAPSATINSPYAMMALTSGRIISLDDMRILHECEVPFTMTVPSDHNISELRRIFGIPPSTDSVPNRITSSYDEVSSGWSWKVNFPTAVVNGEPHADMLWLYISVDNATREVSSMIPWG
jgi:hypothetical protein